MTIFLQTLPFLIDGLVTTLLVAGSVVLIAILLGIPPDPGAALFCLLRTASHQGEFDQHDRCDCGVDGLQDRTNY